MRRVRLDMFQPSASYSALILSGCNHWRRVGAEWYDDSLVDTEKRDSGTKVHKAIHMSWHDPMFHPTLTNDEAHMVRLANGMVEQMLKDGAEPLFEIAMGLDPANGFACIYDLKEDRGYPTDGLMHGTADLITENADGSVTVLDWKTGGGSGARLQLLTLASAYYRITKTQRDFHLVVVYLGDNGYRDEITVNHLTLEAHMEKLALALRSGDSGPVLGPHCSQNYCPHMAHCSAVHELGVAMANENIPEFTTDPKSDTEAGEIMNAIRLLDRRSKYFKEAMKRYVKEGGKPVYGEEEWGNADGNGDFRWRERK